MNDPSALFQVQKEPWMELGACKGQDPNLFILDQGYTTAEAAKFCSRCEVKEPCLEYARRTGSVGVWGGKLFTFRYANPIEILPIEPLQDARPVVIRLEGNGSRIPGILGKASGFKRPGILG